MIDAEYARLSRGVFTTQHRKRLSQVWAFVSMRLWEEAFRVLYATKTRSNSWVEITDRRISAAPGEPCAACQMLNSPFVTCAAPILSEWPVSISDCYSSLWHKGHMLIRDLRSFCVYFPSAWFCGIEPRLRAYGRLLYHFRIFLKCLFLLGRKLLNICAVFATKKNFWTIERRTDLFVWSGLSCTQIV
jgi:hypothetical protein